MMRVPLLLLLLFAWLPAQADGIADLKTFVSGLTTFKAKFQQTVTQGGKVEKEIGILTLKRPTRFRWDYLKPYPHMVLADGFHIWVYDKGLEQVSRQKQIKAVKGSPAQVLTGDVPVETSFKMSNLGEKKGITWVKLVPKDKDSQYDFITVGLQGKDLKQMNISDKLNQTTEIEFSNIERNPDVPWDFFIFEVPKGVDLIDDKSEE